MSTSSRSESPESCVSEASCCHTPVVYRTHTLEDLHGQRAHPNIIKVAELSRRSNTVICLPIFPVLCDPPHSVHRFWGAVSTLPMCQAEISALPRCRTGRWRPEAVQFALFADPRFGSEWRNGEQADMRVDHRTRHDDPPHAELISLVGVPFDKQQISPQHRPQHPMILWLVFHPTGPSAIEMISLPHKQDVFDYDAFGAVPRAYCGLCERNIPEEVMHTPCAFHPGTHRGDMWNCCRGPIENPGCMLERTHLPSEEVCWRGRERWNRAEKALQQA